jgi:hypothetical protein
MSGLAFRAAPRAASLKTAAGVLNDIVAIASHSERTALCPIKAYAHAR